MKHSIFFSVILLIPPVMSNSQTRPQIDSLERELKILNIRYFKSQTTLKRLEGTIDSLKVRIDYEIEINRIRSRLALELNRNFTYAALFYEGQGIYREGYTHQRIFYFNAFRSVADHDLSLKSDQSSYLKAVRSNLSNIKDIVLGEHTVPIKQPDEYTSYLNRLIINYYDNASGGEPIITADTETNSLKVRINGVMQEVGWD